ncbi:cytochrome c biogenesis protein ResB [Thermincola ferriacetica]
MFKKLYQSLLSPFLTIIIFVILTVAISVGTILDSSLVRVQAPRMNSGQVFSSTWFLVLNIFLLAVTMLCTARQFIISKKRWHKYRKIFSAGISQQVQNLPGIFNLAKKYKYRIWQLSDETLAGQKNRIGFWGAPLFHLGIAISMFGIMVDIFAGFTGYLILPPGKIIDDRRHNYAIIDERPLHPGQYNRFQLLLDKVEMKYEKDGVSASGKVSIIKDGQVISEGILDRDSQMNMGLLSLVRDTYGYYVKFRITDQKNKVIIDHLQGLNTLDHGTSTEYSFKNFVQKGTPYRLTFNYYPDVRKKEGRYFTATYQEKNPALHLVARYENKVVYNGLVKAGQEVTMQNGHKFRFVGTIPYLMVRVQWMTGAYILAGGFLLFLLGLIIYYLFPPVVIFIKNTEKGYRVDYLAWTGKEVVKREVARISQTLSGEFRFKGR